MNRRALDFARGASLSARQLEMLRHAAQGRTEHETATRMSIGFETVKSMRRLALAKLGARNITHAVALAYQNDLFSPRT